MHVADDLNQLEPKRLPTAGHAVSRAAGVSLRPCAAMACLLIGAGSLFAQPAAESEPEPSQAAQAANNAAVPPGAATVGQPADTRGPYHPEINSQISAQFRWISCDVKAGRLTVIPLVTGRRPGAQHSGAGVEESLVMELGGGHVQLKYHQASEFVFLAVAIRRGENWQIVCRRGTGENTRTTVFLQNKLEPLVFAVRQDGEDQVDVQPNLWQLFMARAELRDELVPLLQVLKSEWPLAAEAEATEYLLLNSAPDDRAFNTRMLTDWVTDLNAEDQATRETADRRLRDLGPLAESFLRDLMLADAGRPGLLPKTRLQAEQRYRIRRILRDLNQSDVPDDPRQSARRLAASPSTWYQMLSRNDPQTRVRALAELGRMEFDTSRLDVQASTQDWDNSVAQLAVRYPQLAPLAPPDPETLQRLLSRPESILED